MGGLTEVGKLCGHNQSIEQVVYHRVHSSRSGANQCPWHEAHVCLLEFGCGTQRTRVPFLFRLQSCNEQSLGQPMAAQLFAPCLSKHSSTGLRAFAQLRLASTVSGTQYPFPRHPGPTPHQIFHLSYGASQADIKSRCSYARSCLQ